MPVQFTFQQLAFFVILVAALGLLLTERLRNDIVALLMILALAVTGILTPDEALSGFSSEPAIVVACIFVMSAAIKQTGLADTIGGWIGRLAGDRYDRAITVIMPSVALLSAFTHHLTTTAVMLPVVLNLSREKSLPASRLLMPLSFAASLGTCITLIGAPAFLVASSVLQQAERPGLGIFSIAPIGLAISLLGTLYVLLVGQFLLPDRGGGDEGTSRFRLDNYFTEIKVVPNSPWTGRSLAEVQGSNQYDFNVVGWMRAGRRLPGPYAERPLAEGDVLLINTTPEEMVTFQQESGIELHPIEKFGEAGQGVSTETEDVTDQLVQAVIAPRSEFIGRTLKELNFQQRYGTIVVGLWRRQGYVRQELGKVRLREGDVLVLRGSEDELSRAANEPGFLMLVPFEGESRMRRKARLAAAIMAATVAAAALSILPLGIASLAGAVAMVLSGCLTPRQAYRAIDARIYVFIAGAIPLGVAMQKSGAANLLAQWLHSAIGGWRETLILGAIFLIVGLVTQLMSDAASVALFAPVAAALAVALGHSPEAYVVTVAMAAVASFFTPIGHHGNLLVYGPGRYQFMDFVKVGTPLTLLVGAVVVFLAQWLWPLSG